MCFEIRDELPSRTPVIAEETKRGSGGECNRNTVQMWRQMGRGDVVWWPLEPLASSDVPCDRAHWTVSTGIENVGIIYLGLCGRIVICTWPRSSLPWSPGWLTAVIDLWERSLERSFHSSIDSGPFSRLFGFFIVVLRSEIGSCLLPACLSASGYVPNRILVFQDALVLVHCL